ncbi:MAG: penicillin-binding protein 2 [Gemmatimonadota bacterium]|nr:penicillin-binding protein 2 [Gemmatimonadota bacterium]
MLKSDRISRFSGPFDPISRNRRARLARLCLFAGFGVLLAVFFHLQILEHDVHAEQATNNRVRTIPLPAPRGILYDRDGEVIAENLPAYSVSLLPESERELVEGMGAIAGLVDLEPEAMASLVRQYRLAPGQPILIDDDLDYPTLSLLEEKRSEIPSLLLQPKPRRVYPHGEEVAHLVGYVAQIDERELSERDRYAAGDIIGKTGLERMYEDRLRGEKGAEHFEVDALGRRVGHWQARPFEPPRRGNDLRLTIDLDLQRKAAELFPDSARGAVVALDPNSGEVLAMYSHPTFDPNMFSGRMPRSTWSSLVDDPGRPLMNRAIQARYAPGSIFKLATAAMAMMLGVVEHDEYMDIPCKGGYRFGRRWFGCHSVHGWAALADAIITSCDTYFYQLGLKLGMEEFTRFGTAWGFHERTGIDLPSEAASQFPTSVAWYDDHYGEGRWGSGVLLNLSIGQGEMAVTPVKAAQFFAAVVNGGRLLEPRIRSTREAPEVVGRLPLSSDQFGVLRASLSGVINDWRGTAYRKTRAMEEEYTIGGKSGTTEHDAGAPHGWFVAVGPMENPGIVVAVIVEESGSGSDQSPIAVEMVRSYVEGLSGPPDADPAPQAPIALGESEPADQP